MSATMDRRIADRRHSVREDGARRRMRWVLALVVATLLGGVVAWLFFESSVLAVSDISISGAVKADVAGVVAAEVQQGMPTVRVDGDGLVAAILEEPWVAAASVTVTWPGSVYVSVLEHEPGAWVAGEGGSWMLVAVNGAVLETARFPMTAHPTLDIGSDLMEPGKSVDAVSVAGIEFLTVLPDGYRIEAAVSGTPDTLVARVGGHDVALGHPVDMAEKARALAALLDNGVPAGAPINLVSPVRPAVANQYGVNPQVEVEGSEQISSDADSTG